MSGKKGILVVSFGTSYEESLKNCIEGTENFIKDYFSDYEVRRAFTSNMIIKKILERDNIKINTPKEALEAMRLEGFKEVIVQPLHIMFGDEYEKVEDSVEDFKKQKAFNKLEIGRPLLFRYEDYEKAAMALETQLPEINGNQGVLLMAHGTSHPANAAYLQFEHLIKDKINENIFMSTVEGYPLIENIIYKLKNRNIKEVILMPFMLVAGDHASNDMMGEEEDSWKNILISEGFLVKAYFKGIGENIAFQKIYAEHIKDCM